MLEDISQMQIISSFLYLTNIDTNAAKKEFGEYIYLDHVPMILVVIYITLWKP